MRRRIYVSYEEEDTCVLQLLPRLQPACTKNKSFVLVL
jgi:hypothetical protein